MIQGSEAWILKEIDTLWVFELWFFSLEEGHCSGELKECTQRRWKSDREQQIIHFPHKSLVAI